MTRSGFFVTNSGFFLLGLAFFGEDRLVTLLLRSLYAQFVVSRK